ncbi:DUF2441 domain-containing protein [Turneriella parva]|nr:DUF2441 domain-containing protein [Turneriella parva]
MACSEDAASQNVKVKPTLSVMIHKTQFIHRIDTKDQMACHNLVFTKSMHTASLAQWETFQTEHPVYTIDPDSLLCNLAEYEMFLSPRLKRVLMSSWARNGLQVGIGQSETRWLSMEQVQKIHSIAEFEITCEKLRRKINPKLPSRLMCIYLAEDSLDGRLMLANMFGYSGDPVILQVRIKYALRIHRADSKWLEIYQTNRDTTAIEQYWKGNPFNEIPQYEYLIDGAIELVNSYDAENLRQFTGNRAAE